MEETEISFQTLSQAILRTINPTLITPTVNSDEVPLLQLSSNCEWYQAILSQWNLLAVGHATAVLWDVEVLCLAVPSEAADGTVAAADQY
jgi:hypothetical protein